MAFSFHIRFFAVVVAAAAGSHNERWLIKCQN